MEIREAVFVTIRNNLPWSYRSGLQREDRRFCRKFWVHLNKCTETAIDRDEREIVRFLCGFSSKHGLDRETIFLAKDTGFDGCR
jgi:hypothetical protein